MHLHFGLWQILVLLVMLSYFINHVFEARHETNKLGYVIGGILGYGVMLFFMYKAGTFN